MAKTKKVHPGDDLGIPAAMSGDPEGVQCFSMFVADRARAMSMLTPLPPLMKLRLADIYKRAEKLTEFAEGYALGLRDAARNKTVG